VPMAGDVPARRRGRRAGVTDSTSDVPPARLHRVNVFVEAASAAEVEALTEAFEASICSVDHSDALARCPHRWFIMTEDLPPEDAAAWEDLLNE
jgi:hypothetical protein